MVKVLFSAPSQRKATDAHPARIVVFATGDRKRIAWRARYILIGGVATVTIGRPSILNTSPRPTKKCEPFKPTAVTALASA
jgi:hypothetical protein